MSDTNEPDMDRADVTNRERDDGGVPPEQDPDAGYPTSTGVVDDDGELPPLGEELEAD